MSTWSEVSALCDLAIEAIDRRKGARGEERQDAWRTPKKILNAIDAILSVALPEPERALAARLEFEAIERARSGGGLWPVSAKAWRAGVATLGAVETAGMALSRAKAMVKASAGSRSGDHHERREDVGGKLLRVMREGSLFWLEEDGRSGHVGPTGRELSDWALALHGRWCSQIGVLAEWDWESGIHAYGFGVWLDEMEAGGGGKFERWGQELLEASHKAVEQFGRLPRIPEGSGMMMPAWTLLENYAAHEGSGDVSAHSWAWGSRFPMLGTEPWDKRWCDSSGWPSAELSDPRRGRARVVFLMLEAQGRSDLRGEFERWQGRWASQVEGQEIERGLGQLAPEPDASRPARRPAL